MVSPRVHVAADGRALGAVFAAIRREMKVPGAFTPEVLDDAERSAREGPRPRDGIERADRRAIPFVTIDPPGSRDLDQAFAAERRPLGVRVHYAIADVGAFVAPGGPLDAETRARGATTYLPDGHAPLHPAVLGEAAASLLPDGDRPALVWTFELDDDGVVERTHVEPAWVRSRAQLTYAEAQQSIDRGEADESLALLRVVGESRRRQEERRGAVSLELPEQEVVARADGTFALELRSPLPIEEWNAQISLMTGMQAADIMLAGGVGLLRTLPAPPLRTVELLRRAAQALELPWPAGMDYPTRMRTLPRSPASAALMTQAARLLRGAGYAAFTEAPAEVPEHSAIAAAYAHVTAPLRRLGDRFAQEICLALVHDRTPPTWATGALAELPSALARAQQRQQAVDRATTDAVEAATLAHRVGERFEAMVVDVNERSAKVELCDVAVIASIAPDGVRAGQRVRLRLDAADVAARSVQFVLDGRPATATSG